MKDKRVVYRKKISQSGLPDAVQDLILNVTKTTKLWRSEMNDVADELIAHFRDGVDAEQSEGEMIDAFGRPKQAAQLIRKAKKRGRPIAWQMWIRGWQGIGVVFTLGLVWYGCAVVYYNTGSPTIAVDYVAMVTAAARDVPENERAWPHLRQAMLELNSTLEHPENEYLRTNGLSRNPNEVGWEHTASFIRSQPGPLKQIRTACRFPSLGFDSSGPLDIQDFEMWPELESSVSIPTNDPLMSGALLQIQLPHLTSLRKLSQYLEADMQAQAEAGDLQMALEDFDSLLNLGRLCRETQFLITDLVSIDIQRRAFDSLGRVLQRHADKFSSGDIRTTLHRLARLNADAATSTLSVRLEYERYAMLDVLQRVYTDDGNGSGRLTVHGVRALTSVSSGIPGTGNSVSSASFTMPIAAMVMADREEMTTEYNRLMDKVIAESATPLWKRSQLTVSDEIEQLATSLRWKAKYAFIYALFPAISRASVPSELALMQRDGVVVALAVELYRRDQADESLPSNLDQLVPRYLPAVPLDRFNGKPLGYVTNNESSYTIYGVGADKDDDGGKILEERRALKTEVHTWPQGNVLYHRPATAQNGDWILWSSSPEAYEVMDSE